MNSKFNLLFYLLLSSVSFAGDAQDYKENFIKELSSTRWFSFKNLIHDKTLAVLFQPNCSSCKKQIKDLSCLEEYADKIVLIGSFSAESKVHRSYLKKKSPYKGYFVEREKLKILGFEDGISPQTIYYSHKEGLKFLGYKACEKIKQRIHSLYEDQ